MKTYIAILRGINVGGKHSIKMADLKQLLESSDFSEVSTYIQSGNLVFKHMEGDNLEIAAKMAKLITNQYGFEVPVIVTTRTELEEIINSNPQLDGSREAAKLHVTFLAKTPNPEKVKAIATQSFTPDEFAVVGKTIYVHCPNGYGRTRLTNNFFENKLDVLCTTRNWKTTKKLQEMAKE